MLTCPDSSKTLRDPEEVRARLQLLQQEHIAPLTSFVRRIRREFNSEEVPFFDPCDGGVKATALFLLEAPGPAAIGSGFVSRNNPDETAKNIFELHREAGLPRQDVALWNIVPWFVGRNDGRIRPVEDEEIREVVPYRDELLDLLPDLRCIVLVGRKAQRGYAQFPPKKNICLEFSLHPSPVNLRTHRKARGEILEVWRKVASYLLHPPAR